MNVAFWNLQNLFDPDVSAIAAELDFTPVCGWDRQAFESRIRNLAAVIRSMFDGQGPDLLALCEIENERVARRLMQELGRSDYQLAIASHPLATALDTALIYSDKLFSLDPEKIRGHIVDLRFPTIDILEVHLTAVRNNAELMLLINHWPSRREPVSASDAFRQTAASHCRRLIQDQLKLGRRAYLDLNDSEPSLYLLNRIQERNVLVLGDFNDEPWSPSVSCVLGAGYSTAPLADPVRLIRGALPSWRSYQRRPVWLFNPMWSLAGMPDQGTCSSIGATHSLMVRDQMMLSRGLFLGRQGLKLRDGPNGLPEVLVCRPDMMTERDGRPREFRPDRQTGYSDHFPITATMQVLPFD